MAAQTQGNGVVTAAWILGIVIAALGWIPAIVAFLTVGLAALFFAPLYIAGLVLSIMALTRSDLTPLDKSRAIQSLLMTLTGAVIGWFAFLFLLIRMR